MTGIAERVGFLVGPGVLRHLDGLHAAAERVGVEVVNTWGAKGVFRWDSPYHAGTAGLQERDFELAGLGDVDLLITSGLDPDEVTTQPWAGRAEVVDIDPARLGHFAEQWSAPPRTPRRPPLYTELKAVCDVLYADPSTPPARLQAMSRDLPEGGVVVAPPGRVGYWVARTFPTTQPGSVIVPARNEPGIGERRAAEAAAAGWRTTYITDTPVTIAGVDVIVWEDDLTVPDELIAVAGPVVAWT
jgi:hypothetical protein